MKGIVNMENEYGKKVTVYIPKKYYSAGFIDITQLLKDNEADAIVVAENCRLEIEIVPYDGIDVTVHIFPEIGDRQMTVNELIEILKDMPQDAEIRVGDSDGHSDYGPMEVTVRKGGSEVILF